jgi:O-antigen ligase
LIAGLWTVHPVLTESVTNIIGRSDLLAAAALLSGFLFYLKSTESKGWTRVAWLAGLTITTAVGVFSKESAVAILGVIALFEVTWWKDRRQLRGLVLGCVAIAPAFLALFYQRSMVLSGSDVPALSFVDNPLVGAHFFNGEADIRRRDGQVSLAACVARETFLRLFVRRYSAGKWQSA